VMIARMLLRNRRTVPLAAKVNQSYLMPASSQRWFFGKKSEPEDAKAEYAAEKAEEEK